MAVFSPQEGRASSNEFLALPLSVVVQEGCHFQLMPTATAPRKFQGPLLSPYNDSFRSELRLRNLIHPSISVAHGLAPGTGLVYVSVIKRVLLSVRMPSSIPVGNNWRGLVLATPIAECSVSFQNISIQVNSNQVRSNQISSYQFNSIQFNPLRQQSLRGLN